MLSLLIMRKDVAIVLLSLAVLGAGLFFYAVSGPGNVNTDDVISIQHPAPSVGNVFIAQKNIPPKPIPDPGQVKAIHLSYGTYNSSRFSDILAEIENSEVNAIIFEMKNPVGWVALDDDFHVSVLEELLPELNRRGIYTIARMVIFQDPVVVGQNPDFAIKNSATGGPWADYKGVVWADPTNKAVWEYNVDIAKKALDVGFNEINFDYIRFPTDGPLSLVQYSNLDEFGTRENTIVNFAKYAKEELGINSVLSVDVFGITFIGDQKVIGQSIAKLAPYVDVIMPMPYPSHYPDGFIGYANPADHPYEIMHYTMELGMKKLEGHNVIVRSWLQDFDLGAFYNDHEIKEQIRAVEEFDMEGWALWNASNRYTWSAVR
ncbi:MAG: putative glycoside hydrolase [Candidatus Spechtbacterales bacterium]